MHALHCSRELDHLTSSRGEEMTQAKHQIKTESWPSHTSPPSTYSCKKSSRRLPQPFLIHSFNFCWMKRGILGLTTQATSPVDRRRSSTTGLSVSLKLAPQFTTFLVLSSSP